MLLTVLLSGDDGKREKRKLLLFTEQYLELGIHKGSVLDEEGFDELEGLSRVCMAMRKGSDLLSYSSSSRVRLAQRLRSKGIDKESTSLAADRLAEIGAINEELDVERLVASSLKKLWGKKRIYRELCTKGYDRELVSDELSKVDDDTWVQNCIALFRKKHRAFTKDPQVQQKIIASLVRYGYSFSEIKQALQIIDK